ncbi:MAG: hypothetical protein JSV36_04850 [Anaerolineae bacterium]|nr:MAG: hypothetical protein JSV36_04850 [Anaerolineae bacterium]
MGTYGLDEVIRRWEQAALTVEQAIGQILLLLQAFEERLREVEGRPSAPKQGGARPNNKTRPRQ